MNANITLLGVSGSGKTSFISKAVKDINYFSPKITIESKTSEVSSENIYVNKYTLTAYQNVKWDFSIFDYDGIILKSVVDSSFKDMINSSDAWIIFTDGEYFEGEDDEKIIRNIKRKTSRVLLPYISEYADAHNEKIPELLFVVTKANMFIDSFDKKRIKNIIMTAFEGIFEENSSPMILLSETSITRSAGLAVLSLFYIRYSKELNSNISKLSKRNEQISKDVNELRDKISAIEDKVLTKNFPGNIRKLEYYKRQVTYLNSESSENSKKINIHKGDQGLKNLGTCVQCMVDYNTKMIVNGFEKVEYKCDKPMKESSKYFEMALGVKVILFLVILLYILSYFIEFNEVRQRRINNGK